MHCTYILQYNEDYLKSISEGYTGSCQYKDNEPFSQRMVLRTGTENLPYSDKAQIDSEFAIRIRRIGKYEGGKWRYKEEMRERNERE